MIFLPLRAGFNQNLYWQPPNHLKFPVAPGLRAGFIAKASRKHLSWTAFNGAQVLSLNPSLPYLSSPRRGWLVTAEFCPLVGSALVFTAGHCCAWSLFLAFFSLPSLYQAPGDGRLRVGQKEAVSRLASPGDKQCSSCVFLGHQTFFLVNKVDANHSTLTLFPRIL